MPTVRYFIATSHHMLPNGQPRGKGLWCDTEDQVREVVGKFKPKDKYTVFKQELDGSMNVLFKRPA